MKKRLNQKVQIFKKKFKNFQKNSKKIFHFFEKIKNSLFFEYKFFNTKNFFNHINLQFKLYLIIL